MDVVASLNDSAIQVVLAPTVEAFAKILEQHRSEIESVPHKTFRYGPAERHNLDVYYPTEGAASSGPVPVLFFVYGGGFTSGTRRFDPPRDLVYTNVGAYFAKRGILTIIPDYRLVPQVKFPAPLEDVRDAISWFLANTSPVAAAAPTPSLSLEDPHIFAMGHSAGAHILSSLFLLPAVLPLDSPIRAATRGLVLQGGAFKFDLSRPLLPPGLLQDLYGSEEKALELMPVALAKGADASVTGALPDVFVQVSELDPEPIKEACEEFSEILHTRTAKKPRYEVMKGHNHISPHWALFSGEGEEWAEQAAEWIKSKA